MVRCGSKNGYQKYIFSKGIGVHAQNIITFFSSIVNIIWLDLYDHLMGTKIYTLIMDK